jgi:hypothetical protein
MRDLRFSKAGSHDAGWLIQWSVEFGSSLDGTRFCEVRCVFAASEAQGAIGRDLKRRHIGANPSRPLPVQPRRTRIE